MASLLILFTSLLAATAIAQNSSSSTCVNGNAVHMIIARASLENPGPGIIGGVATQVVQQLPGSDIVSVDYPATLDNYQTSEAAGVAAMTKLLTDYAARCPSSKIVMMGYSQGAQVAADVLCGTNEGATFQTTQAVNSSILDRGRLFNSRRGTRASSRREKGILTDCFLSFSYRISDCSRIDGRSIQGKKSDIRQRNIDQRWGMSPFCHCTSRLSDIVRIE